MLRSLMLTVCFSMATLACGGGQSPEAKRTSFDLQVTLEGLVAYVHDEQPVAEGGEPVESWWARMPNAAYDRANADPAGNAFPRGVEYDLVRNRCTLWYPPHVAVVRTHQTAGGPLESMTDLRSYDVRFELEFSDDNAVEPGATFADGHSQPVNLGDVMPGWDYVEDRWVADEVQPSKELATRVLFQHGRISSETIGYEFRRHVVQLEDDACTPVPTDDTPFDQPVVAMQVDIEGLESASVVLTPFGGGDARRIRLLPGADGVARIDLFNKSATHLFLHIDEERHFEDFQYFYNLAQTPDGAETGHDKLRYLAPADQGDDRCTKVVLKKQAG